MLTKNFRRIFRPRIPGRPEIPAREEQRVCYPQQGGSWQFVCRRIEIPDANTGIQIPPGGELIVVRDPNGAIDPLTGQVKVIDIYIQVCASEWVPSSGGEPVCVTYPAVEYQPAVPEVPARWDIETILGWDAGANSTDIIEGDCEVTWTMGVVAGVYVGLTEEREAVPDPGRIAHGLMFHLLGSRPHFRVVEYGEARSSDRPYSHGDEFRIRRVRDKVAWLHNGDEIHSSLAHFMGPASVGCSLYASGDMIP